LADGVLMKSQRGKLREFLEGIPKSDLHVHLDGSLRIPTLIEMARQTGVKLPSHEEAGLRELVFKEVYAGLPEYLRGFAYTCAVLNNAENLERVAYELAQDNLAEGVRYIEVRFAPQLHVRRDLSIERIVTAVCRGLERAQKEHQATSAVMEGLDIPFRFGIITCALRRFTEGMSLYYDDLLGALSYAPRKAVFAAASLELARAAADLAQEKGLPVVAFDLAGEEAGYPAEDHREAYDFAHRHFLNKTVHAGEAYGPESIFQAITDLHADRLGHGTFLFAADMIRDPAIRDPDRYVRSLARFIAEHRITIEVCPTSNLQTIPALRTLADHPVARMLENNLSVTICTDNRLISSTTVSREIELLVRHLPVTAKALKNLIIYGFKRSFFPGSYSEKRAYVRKAINLYERMEARFVPPEARGDSGVEWPLVRLDG